MERSGLKRDFFRTKELIGESKAMKNLKEFIKKMARVNHPILITGETGVGKELVSRKIHELSERGCKTFISVNCANLPENLIESELFGYRKGSFTDAKEDKVGLIDEASGGTLFFDEISELPFYLQAKLLRVIENQEIRRLGDTKTRKIDVRFIFATNKELKEEIKEGCFRKDLYYRISTLEIYIPPLRERKEDISLLAQNVLKEENGKNRKDKRITPQALSKLLNNHYPGNIRELENIIKRAHALSDGNEINTEDIELTFTEEKEDLNVPEKLYRKMVNERKSFWEVVHKPFLGRELNRREVKEIIALGIKQTKGSYKKLLPVFNIDQKEKEYKRFMGIIRFYKLK